MKYDEMKNIFFDNGIDIEKYGYIYNLKLTVCGPSEGYIINQNTGKYAHIIIGDRDNGKIDKEYDSEDEAVSDMICDIRRAAIRHKAKYNKYPNNTELNTKILNISTYLYYQINGYKGYHIWKDSDHDTWQAYYIADYYSLDGKDSSKTIYSFMWEQDSRDARELERKALNAIKKKIDDNIENNKE